MCIFGFTGRDSFPFVYEIASAAKIGAGGSHMQKKTKSPTAKGRQKKPKELTPLDRLKLEIAQELGLAEKIARSGWAELTAAESGRLGGILNRRLKELKLAIGPKGTLIPTAKS
ncbi:small acid-soluble spore protein [Symbiobacterium thermophilum IAM 14863]|uniref:Small acid-soluble spore protein n=2 Tax=Symbiobacterium thermophilum TaxID=2734 RepID=Q67L02_SYMTH|nr:small acid-soluble spore protein [Symbiobacterium thermophilum IAM 14863]